MIKQISIVPDMIAIDDIIFTDDNDIRKVICEPSEIITPISFSSPYIIIDNFDKNKNKVIDIVEISIYELEKLGFKIISIPTTSKIRNFPRQITSYCLESKKNLTTTALGGTTLVKTPREHIIEKDITNNRVRLRGKGCFPYNYQENASPWRNING